MSRNDKNTSGKKFSAGSLLENNKVVAVISVIVAILCWGFVSMYKTPETEKLIQNVKVQITGTEEMYEQYGLAVFDALEQTVDVTVKGPNYIINSSSFTSDSISVTASCASVDSVGTYPLTISASVNGISNNVQIVKLSKSSLNVYFDKEVEKEFTLNYDIQELEGYSLAEGLLRETPELSADTVVISGPSRDINKITSVNAHIELNSMLKTTEKYPAELIAQSDSGTLDLTNIVFKNEAPIYITIPLTHTGTYETAVSFSGVPEAYKAEGLEYSVVPSEIDVTVAATAGSYNIESNQINVGNVDFSQIAGETVNYIKLKSNEGGENETTFTVVIDTTDFYVRWTTVPVDLADVDLPDNVSVTTKEINSVRLVGPKSSLLNIDKTVAYAVPDVKAIGKLKPGQHKVPAVIYFRTLKDSWVYGNYELDVTVK